MSGPVIETPRGRAFVNAAGKAELVFNPSFKPKWQGRYTRAQKFVDSEVLRLSEPFTPLVTGLLIKSGSLGTEVGSGLVQWIAPYAKSVYYSAGPIGRPSGALRGAYWFERMKQVHRSAILSGARKLAGRG